MPEKHELSVKPDQTVCKEQVLEEVESFSNQRCPVFTPSTNI